MCSLKLAQRLQAEWVLSVEQLQNLVNCCLNQMRRNSILEEFMVKRLAVIKEEIMSYHVVEHSGGE